MKHNVVTFCGFFYMRKEYEQCLHYTGVDLLNNEDSGVLRSVVCPFTSETDCI